MKQTLGYSNCNHVFCSIFEKILLKHWKDKASVTKKKDVYKRTRNVKELEDTLKDLAWTKQNRSSVKHARSKGDFQTKWILQNVCEERNGAANMTQGKSAQELKALVDAFLYIEVKITINTRLLYQPFYRLWQWKFNVLKARWLLVSRKPKTGMSQFRSQQLTALLSTVQETIKEK